MSGELAELYLNSAWVDVSRHLKTDASIAVDRGKGELARQAGPASCSFSLDDGPNGGDGDYSPRNPLGAYFGQLGRNTPVRLSKQVDPTFDAYSRSSGTGDLSFTHTPAGAPTGVVVFVWQYNSGAGEIASVTYGGVLMDRKIFGLFTLGASQAVGYMYWLNRNIPTGPQTVVVDTTAVRQRQCSVITVTGGSNAEIETQVQAYSNATPSANPAAAIVTTKRTLLFGTLLSDLDDGSTIGPGIGYTQLNEEDLGTETVSTQRTGQVQNPSTGPGWGITWTAASAHWAIMGVAVRATSYRFYGELAELPPRKDLSHKIRWVPITANGILRRLGQGNEPAKTGLREYILSQPQSLTSYWPLSGAEGTTYSVNLGRTWQGSTRFFPLNFPVFKYGVNLGGAIGNVMELNATGPTNYMVGDVGTSEDSGVALDFIWQADGMGVLKATVEDYKDSGIKWAVNLNDSTDAGTLFVSYDDGTGPIAFAETGLIPALQDNGIHHCRLQLIVVGADTNYEVFIDGISVKTGTMSGTTWLGTALVYFNYSRYPEVGQTVMNLGHVTVWSENNPANIPSAADVTEAMRGYAGETAGDRMERVAGLAGIPITIVGDNAETTPMGVQFSEPTLKQIRDAESTDLGVLTEARDANELVYRSLASQYNQTPKLVIDYAAKQVAPPFEVVDDDAALRNDVTASRRDGDSFRITQTTGSLSTAAPPNGVGPYPDEIEVNYETDANLPNAAAWFLNLGTLDKLRFPTLTINLAAAELAGLESNVLAVDVGDLVRVENLTNIDVYDDLDLIVTGYSEDIGPVVHTITFKLAPADLYLPATYATSETVGTTRYDTYSSALATGVNSSALALSISSVRTLWTRDVDAFPLDITIGGERMTVQSISGATSPQTFTLSARAVNGVSKSHAAGAEVHVYPIPRYALL